MSKRKNYIIELNNDEFKKIKKNKQSIFCCLDNDIYKDIKLKDEIVFINGKKKINKRVKKIYKYSTYEELCKNIKKKKLGYRKKEDIDYNKFFDNYIESNIKNHGVLGIEINVKKHIFRKILLIILVIITLSFIISKFNNYITDMNINKFKTNISNIEKEKVNYVFIEINPSLVLTLNNNIVKDVACLNDDCLEIYNNIDIKGKSINESIDDLYNLSKEKGYNISNGVKIKTSNKINIENKEYINIEYIDTTKEKELLNEVRNNEEIKNIDNGNYYSKLWEELKKDTDYGDVYTCNMNDNKELECYIKEDFVVIDKDLLEMKDMVEIIANYPKVIPRLEKIERVLKKFGFNVRTVVTDLFISPAEIINVRGSDFSYVTGGTAKDVYYSGRIHCSFYKFYLTNLNLLKPDSIPLIYDEEDDFDYDNNDDHYFKRTIIDEDNYIDEIYDRYCNEVMCYIEVRRVESQCKVQEKGNYDLENKETTTCQECELGYKNCVYVSCDKYRIN